MGATSFAAISVKPDHLVAVATFVFSDLFDIYISMRNRIVHTPFVTKTLYILIPLLKLFSKYLCLILFDTFYTTLQSVSILPSDLYSA